MNKTYVDKSEIEELINYSFKLYEEDKKIRKLVDDTFEKIIKFNNESFIKQIKK